MKVTVRQIKGKFHATITFWDGVVLEFYDKAKFQSVCRIIDNHKEATA